MPSGWAFVDSIASSPTVRLDLNSQAGGLMLAADPDLSPPKVRRVLASSMMADGDRIPAAAYENRVLRLSLRVLSATNDLAADKLQALARELVRRPLPGSSETGNIIRATIATNAMFFKTYPAPDAAYEMVMKTPNRGLITLEIPCEPFGYGLLETLSPATVTANPAAGSNGMFFDITSPKGDVETPLEIRFTNGSGGLGATGRIRSALSVRRRGTVANTPLFLQAEAMTVGTDTTTQANSASFSGSSNNWTRTTPGTTAMSTRLSTTTRFPGTASVDARGVYRVFGRFRLSVISDLWDVRLNYGSTNVQITGDTVRVPTPSNVANIFYVDLGVLQIPVGFDPVTDSTGVELAAEGLFLQLQAQRVSGSGSLDTDVLLFVPADDRSEYIKWPTVQNFSTDVFVATGGPRPSAFCLNTSGQLSPVESIEIAGGGLMISPGRTNRVFFIRDIGTGTSTTASGSGDSVTATNILTARYHPRYLFPLKPATT
jgi:hypothetical protein